MVQHRWICIFLLCVVVGALWVPGRGQQVTQAPPDISEVSKAGKVIADKYQNSFFRLIVDAPHAKIQFAPVVGDKRARLVQIVTDAPNWNDKYTFAVLADALSKYPQLASAAVYVRSARHQLEKQGLTTIQEEFPINISGAQFTDCIIQEQNREGSKYYRGLYSTFRSGYILSFDVEGPSEAALNEMVTNRVHLGGSPLDAPLSGMGTRSGPPPAGLPLAGTGGVAPPRLTSKVQPELPPGTAGETGIVLVRAVIGPDGKVQNAKIARSLRPDLDEKALEAVKQWRFKPAEKDGHKVAVLITIEVNFRMK